LLRSNPKEILKLLEAYDRRAEQALSGIPMPDKATKPAKELGQSAG
jgi:hypothetical protein